VIRSQKLRKSAEGESCTFNYPGVCNYDASTVVWCHSNFLEHGKGVGLKASDVAGFYGCSACHRWFDEDSKRIGVPKDERLQYFYRAHSKSLLRAIELGIIKLA
jgi:hypothetical protein